MGDEHIPVGYDGMIRTGEILLNIMSRKKFNQVLQKHVALPYTDWWLSQEDPFLLARDPSVLNDVVPLNNTNDFDEEEF